MAVIEARAVISATDKTGGVFDKIAGKFKEIASSAKAIGTKPLGGMSDAYFSKSLRDLKATAAEMQIINKSARDFQAALKSGGPMRASRFFDSLSFWREQTIGNLRAVRVEMERHEAARRRLMGAVGPIGRGARMAVGAVGVGSAAYAANRGFRGAVRAGSESLREGARDYLAGLTEGESSRLKSRSGELSRQYPSITSTTLHERLRDTSMSMRSVDKAFEVSEAIAKGTVVLQSLKGKDQAVEEGRKFFRGLDVLGKNMDPKQVEGLFNGYVKALGVEGADLNLGDVFQVAKQSRAAGLALSDRFLMSTVPGLIGDMGAPQVGTALASGLSQAIGGRATKESKTFQQSVGLRDAKGNFRDKALMQSDPDRYAWNKLIPAMQAKGINVDDATAVTEFLSKAFSNRTVADLFGKLILQKTQYQGKDAQYQKAPGLAAAGELPGRDPFVAAEGFISQLKNFAASLTDPVFPVATSVLNSLSGAIGAAAQRFGAGDRGEKIGMALGTTMLGGGAIAGGVMAGKGIYQWFTGAGALTGSAAALNSSAAALTAAAASLAGSNAASKVVGGAAGAAGGAAAAGAGGGVFGKLVVAGAAAIPFLPAAIASAATIGGLIAYRQAKQDAGTDGMSGLDAAKRASGGSRLDHLRESFNSDRERIGLPKIGEQNVKAEVEGNATLNATVTLAPSPYFMSTIDAKIDSRINAFKSSGVTSTGTAGSTGRSAPDAAASE
ncbi:MAG: hypothetical protein IJ935_03140 [Afipia sp.]|nr:hypothetical protein [Afipia sp.]